MSSSSLSSTCRRRSSSAGSMDWSDGRERRRCCALRQLDSSCFFLAVRARTLLYLHTENTHAGLGIQNHIVK
ncbi:hypothetical protein EON65_14120 [archaeon]|nr:MAG: hypothetical protein EON65_14120 [archaeon]